MYVARILGVVALGATSALASAACSSSGESTFDFNPDSGVGVFASPDAALGAVDGKAADLSANDPPGKWCGPAAGPPAPPMPSGSEKCPSDKNKPGCPCTKEGEEAACWTGLRANRNLGICKDGMTKCEKLGETRLVWADCAGEVLPDPSVKKGKNACTCFSQGQWKLANTSPCFLTYNDNGKVSNYGISTVVDGKGVAQCPAAGNTPPPPKPKEDWTTDTLKVDCAGHFKLCYEMKAGNFDAPSAADCSLAKLCVEADYLKENVEQPFPNLPSWLAASSDCAKKFMDTGGYGEMTVVGESVRCDKIDDGAGKPFMFNRVRYCQFKCNQNPSLPECKDCQQGGSGVF